MIPRPRREPDAPVPLRLPGRAISHQRGRFPLRPRASIRRGPYSKGGPRMRIRSLGIVGAGTMGSGIAALAASAGIPVVLLDVPGKDADRDAPARGGLDRAKKAK